MYSLALALLQQPDVDALMGTFLLVFLVVFVAIYAFVAFCFQKIAEKTGTENGWWAWIPILNVVLMLNIAGRPIWWIILFFIPLVSIVIAIVVLVDILKALNKSPWLVIGLLIPGVNFIVLGYLAFAD
jgi:hypothetical protein